MDVTDFVGSPSPAPAHPETEEDETSTIYARIPRRLFHKLRRRALELSEGRRKKVTQQDLIIAALRQYLGEG
jgi:hypothetical protein